MRVKTLGPQHFVIKVPALEVRAVGISVATTPWALVRLEHRSGGLVCWVSSDQELEGQGKPVAQVASDFQGHSSLHLVLILNQCKVQLCLQMGSHECQPGRLEDGMPGPAFQGSCSLKQMLTVQTRGVGSERRGAA